MFNIGHIGFEIHLIKKMYMYMFLYILTFSCHNRRISEGFRG